MEPHKVYVLTEADYDRIWSLIQMLEMALDEILTHRTIEDDRGSLPFDIPSNQIPGYATVAVGGVLTWLAVFAGFAGKNPCEDDKYLEKDDETSATTVASAIVRGSTASVSV